MTQAYTLFPDQAGGLSSTITNALFKPIDPDNNPTVTTGAGAVMPYFALDYFRIKSPIIRTKSSWPEGYVEQPGCFPGKYAGGR